MRNVVVGVDGTDRSFDALTWAAGAVGVDGRLHAVVALNPWTEYYVDAVTHDHVPFAEFIERGLIDEWTASLAGRVRELVTSVSVQPASTALRDAADADRADAIVVGRHQPRGNVVPRIGLSTNRLLRLTHRPVIVVPPADATTASGIDGGTVVVGVGHGDATRSAVRWVAHLARTRQITVDLVHATGDAPVFQAETLGDLVPHGSDEADASSSASGRVEHFAELMRTLAGPGIDISISTPGGHAASALDDASQAAALLVIGRHRSRLDRGHHTAQPLRHALTHARCPVVVIADHPNEDLAPDGASAGTIVW